MTKEEENKCIEILENLISGEVLNIGTAESDALIALRKEFLRRNLTISGIIKEIDSKDTQLITLFNEF